MDHPSRRAFSKGLLTALAGTTMPLLAWSQSSTRPGRIVVGYPAGGTLDQTARRFADAWRQQGRAYIVDTRAGAAGRLANAQLKRERADGSVVLCTHTSSLTIYLPYLASGKLRILGTTGQQRSRFMPKVATFAEQGFAGVAGVETYGLFLPPQASDATVNALHEAAKVASETSVVKAGFNQIGMDPIMLPPREFAQRLAKERERWRPIVQASGFTSQQ